MHTRALMKGSAVRVNIWHKGMCTVRYGIVDTVTLPKICVRHRGGHIKQYNVRHVSRVWPIRAAFIHARLLTVRGVITAIPTAVRYLYHYPFPEKIDE